LRSKWAVGKTRGERLSDPFDALSLAQGIDTLQCHVYSLICVEWLAMSKRKRVEWFA
jgi:hypothetical protein